VRETIRLSLLAQFLLPRLLIDILQRSNGARMGVGEEI